MLALLYLVDGGKSKTYNMCNGQGYSINEVITAAKAVTGENFKFVMGASRDGDPVRLVADSKLIQSE